MRSSRRLHLGVATALLAVGLAAYLNAMRADFAFDDYHMIVHNNHIKDLHLLPRALLTSEISSVPLLRGMYRPVLMASFAFNYAFARLNPVGYHIVNLLLHWLNAVALYALMTTALPGIAPIAAGLSALGFVLHPLHSQAVTYISSRSALLATTWYLAAILGYATWRRTGEPGAWRWPAAAWASYLLGLGSKEIAISLPGVIVLWEVVVGRRLRQPARWRAVLGAWLGFAVIGLAYLAWRRHLIGAIGVVHHVRDPLVNGLTQLVVGVFFLRLWLWPSPLTVDRAFPAIATWAHPWAILALVGLAALVAWGVWWRRRRPAALFGVGWFLVAFYPVALASSLNQVAAEHHAYLPSVGWHVALAAALSAWLRHRPRDRHRRRRLVIVLAIPILVAAGIATVRRTADWRNGFTIWSSAVRSAPASCRAHANLGVEYEARGQLEAALVEYETGLRLATTPVEEATVRNNLGNLYARLGRTDEAEAEFRQAIVLSPHDQALYWNNLGLLYKDRGRLAEALEAYDVALRLRPDLTEAHLNRGVAHFLQGATEAAEADFQRAIQANRDYTLAHLTLGKFYEHEGRAIDAEAAYRQAARLDPANPDIHCRWGAALARLGNPGALAAFEQALRLEPRHAEAHYNLAVALSALEPPPVERVRHHLDEAVRWGWQPDERFVQRVQELEASAP